MNPTHAPDGVALFRPVMLVVPSIAKWVVVETVGGLGGSGPRGESAKNNETSASYSATRVTATVSASNISRVGVVGSLGTKCALRLDNARCKGGPGSIRKSALTASSKSATTSEMRLYICCCVALAFRGSSGNCNDGCRYASSQATEDDLGGVGGVVGKIASVTIRPISLLPWYVCIAADAAASITAGNPVAPQSLVTTGRPVRPAPVVLPSSSV